MRPWWLVSALVAGMSATAAAPDAPTPEAPWEAMAAALASGQGPPDGHLRRLVPAGDAVAMVEVGRAEAAAVLSLPRGGTLPGAPGGPANFAGLGARVLANGVPVAWPYCQATLMDAWLTPVWGPERFVHAEPAAVQLAVEPVCHGFPPSATWASVIVDLRDSPEFYTNTCASAQVPLIDVGTACGRDGWDLGCARGNGHIYLFQGWGSSAIFWVGGTSAIATLAPGASADDAHTVCGVE